MIVDTHAHYWRWPANQAAVGSHVQRAKARGEKSLSYRRILQLMNSAGVDKLIQVTRMIDGYDNGYSLEGAARYPERFRVFGRFDPRPGAIRERLTRWMAEPFMLGARFVILAPEETWLWDGVLDPFWPEAERLDIPVSIYAPHHAKELGCVARRFAGLRLIVDHLTLNVDPTLSLTQRFEAWEDLFDLVNVPNVFLKLSGLPEATDEKYPYPTARAHAKRVYEEFGADRLMWGSDYPVSQRVSTYQEAVDFIRISCDFFSDADRLKVLGGTANRVLRLDW